MAALIQEELNEITTGVTKSCYPLLHIKRPQILQEKGEPKKVVCYCACGKPAKVVGDGFIQCKGELEEAQQEAIFNKFWENVKHPEATTMEKFLEEAEKISGRKLEFDDLSKVTLNKNLIALLLFYTRRECGVIMNVRDFTEKCGKVGNFKAYQENESIKFPICLNDLHIIQGAGGVGQTPGIRSRLLVEDNMRYLEKFFNNVSALMMTDHNLNLKIFGYPITELEKNIGYVHVFTAKNYSIKPLPTAKIQSNKIPKNNNAAKQNYYKVSSVESSVCVDKEKQPMDFFVMTLCEPCNIEKKMFQLPMCEYNEMFRPINVEREICPPNKKMRSEN